MVAVVEAVIGLPAPRVIAVDTVAITMAARHAAWALEQTAASSRSSRVSPAIPCEFVSPVALLPSPEDAARRFERLGMNIRHTDDQRQSGEISRLVVAAPLARGTPDTPWHLATSATRAKR